jgi:hypothetical protein
MNRNALFYLKNGLLVLFILIVLGYSFFQVRNIVFGPNISLQSPLDGQTYVHALIDVKGTATNINYLTLDDRPILTDLSGNFDEKILLLPGSNNIKLYAENKFGKKTEKILQIIYTSDGTDLPAPTEPDTTTKSQVANPVATSTISTTTTNN